MIEIGICIAAIGAFFYGGKIGAAEGLFRSFSRFLLGLLAFIVALRFWYPATYALTEKFSIPTEQATFAVFWIVLIAVSMPFLALLKTLNNELLPVYPIPLERLMGFVFGVANAVILTSALLFSLIPNFPKILPNYDENKLVIPLHRLPTLLYRPVENTLARPTDLAAKTLLPAAHRSSTTSPIEIRWE